jgi:signal transduction histidine kinase
VEGYRIAWPALDLRYDPPGSACVVHCAPDLVVQLLDKLISNALEFGTPGRPVHLSLRRRGGDALLAVENEGPALPAAMGAAIFDSMVSIRERRDDPVPHLGLGLYIVRLVAEFHGGRVFARNRADGRAVRIGIELPLHELDQGLERM